jgi:hypothetical protein
LVLGNDGVLALGADLETVALGLHSDCTVGKI